MRRSLSVVVGAAAATTLFLAGCNDSAAPESAPNDRAAVNRDPGASAPEPPPQSAATITSSVSDHAHGVPVDTAVTVSVDQGTLQSVVFTTVKTKERLPGALSRDNTQWAADDLLEPGMRYVVESRAVDDEGLVAKARTAFRTEPLTLDEQTYASITPLDGEIVGVGMPVIVQFDVPVKHRALFERNLHVTSTPAQKGSWHWYSDQEVHWRPKHYWKSGTRVHVDLQLNSLDAGDGVYGQMDREVSFKVGRSVVMKTNLATHVMTVRVDGSAARRIPITGGKDGFESRSGIKLIIEKFRVKHMRSATIGIKPGDPEYYDISNVEYAQRVTFSGEFVHAAPWSLGDQGSANVSHGCVGMSTDNAAWLYGLTHRGDPVVVTGTSRSLEDGNGWTDWNESFADYKADSAL